MNLRTTRDRIPGSGDGVWARGKRVCVPPKGVVLQDEGVWGFLGGSGGGISIHHHPPQLSLGGHPEAAVFPDHGPAKLPLWKAVLGTKATLGP